MALWCGCHVLSERAAPVLWTVLTILASVPIAQCNNNLDRETAGKTPDKIHISINVTNVMIAIAAKIFLYRVKCFIAYLSPSNVLRIVILCKTRNYSHPFIYAFLRISRNLMDTKWWFLYKNNSLSFTHGPDVQIKWVQKCKKAWN